MGNAFACRSPELLGSTKRPNINHQDEDGFSALHHAALNGNTEIMNLLLEAQAHVDMKDNKGLRPLHYAAWQGKVEPLRILLKAGSSVNLQSGDGQIPLHLSVQNGHYQVSELLLQHQANPCIVNNNNKTPLDLACEFGRLRVVKLLLSSNVCPTLLEGRPHDPSHPNSTSALHLAAKNGHVDIIRMLILAGVDVNRQTRVGTALHEAALYGKTEVVRLLIESGVNVHIRNSYNQTALDIVNQFTGSQACLEIKQMLREATSMLQVRALRDYCNVYDPTSLSVKAGEVITVLEQHPDGRWKGYIQDSRGADRVGFFPPSVVELVSRRNGTVLFPHSRGTPQGKQTWYGLTSTLWTTPGKRKWYGPIYTLTTPGKRGDRSSIGSTGSVGSSRSSGSGQSAGSGNGQHHASNGETAKVQRHTPGRTHARASERPVLETRGTAEQGFAFNVGLRQYDSGRVFPQEAEAIYLWLREFQLEQYVDNFINAGYDLPTISRMTPEDLTAIGVTKPGHRKKITSEISKLNVQDWLPDYRPAGLGEWLALIGLAQYHATLVENGYEKLEFVSEITWEDLHEIGITKLGHQKKLMLAVRRLSELQRFEEQHQARLEGAVAASGTLKRRPGPASPASTTTMAIVSHGPGGDPGSPSPAQPLLPQPPHHPQPGSPASCRSPKLSTFQDSELSPELQAAMSGVACLATLSPGVTRDSAGLVARAIRYGGDVSASQESLGGRSGGSGNSQPTAAFVFPCPGGGKAGKPPGAAGHSPARPRDVVRTPPYARQQQRQQQQRQLQDSPRSPVAFPFPPPPATKGPAYAQTRSEPPTGPGTTRLAGAMPVLPLEAGVAVRPAKKRSQSLSRYGGGAASDGEHEAASAADDEPRPFSSDALFTVAPAGGKYGPGSYATLGRRVGRSHSVRGRGFPLPPPPDAGDGTVNRSHSFAVRQRKRGPPPTPPKRSSSTVASGSTLADTQDPEAEGEDAAASVDAASSELKTGARKRTTSEPPCASSRLEVGVQKAAPEGGLPPAKQLGMESSPCSSQGSSAESIPFAEEGNQTIKQRPKNGWSPTRGEALDYEGNVIKGEALGPTHGDGSRNVDNAAFLASVEDPSAFEQGLGAPEINLTETDTVKRRPKARSPQKSGEAAVARVQPRAAAQPPLPPPPPPDYPPGSLPPPPPPPPMSVKTGTAASPSEQDVVFKRDAGRPHKKPPLHAHLFSSEPSNNSSSSNQRSVPHSPGRMEDPAATPVEKSRAKAPVRDDRERPPESPGGGREAATVAAGDGGRPELRSGMTEVAQHRLEETSASLAAALQAVEDTLRHDGRGDGKPRPTGNLLDDIGSMFDDLADQLDAMLD
ncbi:unnamed protein product [Lampetra planeri]